VVVAKYKIVDKGLTGFRLIADSRAIKIGNFSKNSFKLND